MEDFLTFLFVCIVGGVVGLPAFIILLFWARPERWTFKSFCLWLATWVSWVCCPPLYVWIERKWRWASWRRCSYALLSPISLISLIYVCSFVSDIVNKPYGAVQLTVTSVTQQKRLIRHSRKPQVLQLTVPVQSRSPILYSCYPNGFSRRN